MKKGQKLNLQLLLSLLGLLFIAQLAGQQPSQEAFRQQFIQQTQPYLNSLTLINEGAKTDPSYHRWVTASALTKITPEWLQQADFSRKVPPHWVKFWQSGQLELKGSLDLLEDYVFYQEELNPVLGFMSRDTLALLMTLVEGDTAVFLLKENYHDRKVEPDVMNLHRLCKDPHQEPTLNVVFSFEEFVGQELPSGIMGEYFVKTTKGNQGVVALIREHSLSVQGQDWQIVYKGKIAAKVGSAYRILAKNQNQETGYFLVKIVGSPGIYWQLSLFEPADRDYTIIGEKKMKDSYQYQRMARRVLYVLVIVLGSGSTLAFGVYFFIHRRRKYQQARAQMVLSGLRAQLNPHFLFNTLTSIQDLMNRDDKPAANRYFSEMAQLLRYVVDSSAEEYTSLASELAALEKYCSLEALRTPFTYEFNLHPDLDLQNIEIPTMLLQPFVENAILHGLRPSSEARHLKISLWPEGMDRLGIAIIDDGIGIEESKSRQINLPTQRGHQGLNTTMQRIHLLNQGKRQKIVLGIEDRSQLVPQQSGTQVQLSIPV